MSKVNENYRSVTALWEDFLVQHPENHIKETPPSFYFCDNQTDADECADLVVKGIKQATATSIWWFNKHKEALPKAGDQFVVTDWDGNAKAIIETTKIEQVPFNKITEAFAEIEGEGDKSLAYWKKVHEAYFTREMEPFGEPFDEHMVIVCEHFKTLFCGK